MNVFLTSAKGVAMTYRPITHRAFQWFADTTSIPSVVVGVFIAALFGALGFWLAWVTGVVADVGAGHTSSIALRAIVTNYVMVGYLPLALYYLGVWTFNHIETLTQRFALASRNLAYPRLALNLAGAFGVVAVYLMFMYQPQDPWELIQPSRWTADYVIPLVGVPLMGWFIFRLAYLLAWSAIVISRTAQHIDSIDLLDTSSVKPYAQHGVRSSLLAIISLSITANLWLDPASPVIGTVLTVVMLVAAAVIALFLPTWGIHQRLKSLKQRELDQVRNAITVRRNPQMRSLEDAHQLRTDLLLEQRLQEVSEWPFDAGSYGRVALYIFLGFSSWVGAALVERGLESFGS